MKIIIPPLLLLLLLLTTASATCANTTQTIRTTTTHPCVHPCNPPTHTGPQCSLPASPSTCSPSSYFDTTLMDIPSAPLSFLCTTTPSTPIPPTMGPDISSLAFSISISPDRSATLSLQSHLDSSWFPTASISFPPSSCSASFPTPLSPTLAWTCSPPSSPSAKCTPLAQHQMVPPLCPPSLSSLLSSTPLSLSLTCSSPSGATPTPCSLDLFPDPPYSNLSSVSCIARSCISPSPPSLSIVTPAHAHLNPPLLISFSLSLLILWLFLIYLSSTIFSYLSSLSFSTPSTPTSTPTSTHTSILTSHPVLTRAHSSSTHRIHSPSTLTFSSISYSIPSSDKTILTTVSGSAHGGSVLGMLGASGAGKSTLLTLLAGLPLHGTIHPSSSLTLNGSPVPLSSHKQRIQTLGPHIAIVADSTPLPPLLTVRELLVSRVILKIPHLLASRHEADTFVDALLDTFRMSDLADVYANGSAAPAPSGAAGLGMGPPSVSASSCSFGCGRDSHLSGGERKRVAIMLGIIDALSIPGSSPCIVIMDEPTSSLDAGVALSVASILKHLTSLLGWTTLVTLHQPSPNLLAQSVDSLLVLAPGGISTFFGPPSEIGDLQQALSAPSSPPSSSPPPCHPPSSPLLTSTPPHPYPRPLQLLNEIGVEVQREALFGARSAWVGLAQLSISLLSSITLAALFYDLELDLIGAQDRAGLLFFVLALNGLMLLGTVRTWSRVRALIVHERRTRVFSTSILPLAISKTLLTVLVPALTHPLIFGLVLYPWVGLRPDVGSLFRFLGIIMAFNVMNGSLGLALGALFVNSPAAASLVVLVCNLFSMLTSGFLLASSSGSSLFNVLASISSFRYGFEALLINELADAYIDYNPVGFPGQVKSGNVILIELGMSVDRTQISHDVGAMLGLGLAFLILAVIILYIRIR